LLVTWGLFFVAFFTFNKITMADKLLSKKIEELKKKRNAVILVHNYQPPEVQDIADYLGDSLELSRLAADTKADIILFCGVHFMAETASLLSPNKAVLVPEISAGCPMADMITAKKLKGLKKENPGAVAISYVNTTAEVKAESDICCTSANAEKVVNSVPNGKILFVPDRNLGSYAAKKSGKDLILFDGYCPVHEKITAETVKIAKEKYPNCPLVVHPECRPEVIDMADKVLSTGGMCVYAKKTPAKGVIIGTDIGIIYRLKKENPGKNFYPVSPNAICINMKYTTLDKVIDSLENFRSEVKVPESIRIKAKKPIEKMLEISKPK